MPVEILMPALSPTMTEGNLAKWLKKEGDTIAPGDVIAEIETDKATMEVEATDEGTLGKILTKAGTQNVAVNTVIALVLEEGENAKALEDYATSSAKKQVDQSDADEKKETKEKTTRSNTSQSTDNTTSTPQKSAEPPKGLTPPPSLPFSITTDPAPIDHSSSQKSITVSPVAKRLAQEHALNLKRIPGSGPHGRIVKKDIEQALMQAGAPQFIQRNPQEYSVHTHDTMRKIIANRLLQSKQHVPHFYLNIECTIDKLLELRQDLNTTAHPIDGHPAYKISVNDMIIKACAKALQDVPQANASWSEEALIFYNNIDISVAVAIDGGLITPIIKNADQKNLPAISHEMKKLADRARKNKLTPEEFQGGGFSISNLGMYGIKHFNAIINPPQSCILAIGAGEQKPIVEKGTITKATVMGVSLSCDHRVVDGATGAQFLSAFRGYIEKPVTLLL